MYLIAAAIVRIILQSRVLNGAARSLSPDIIIIVIVLAEMLAVLVCC